MMKRQRKHVRVSKKGKKFVAGRGGRKGKSVTVKLPDETQAEILSHIKAGHGVTLKNFGVIRIKDIPARPARKGMNPFTGQEQMFKAKPASKKIKFFASKKLKEVL